MGILEHTQVLREGGIGPAHLIRPHKELGAAQSATRNEFFVCAESVRWAEVKKESS